MINLWLYTLDSGQLFINLMGSMEGARQGWQYNKVRGRDLGRAGPILGRRRGKKPR